MAKSKKSEKAVQEVQEAVEAVQEAAAAVTEAAAETSAPRGPKGVAATATITMLVEGNPKRAGSAAYERFNAYKEGMTVTDALAAGITTPDLVYDAAHGFIAIEGYDVTVIKREPRAPKAPKEPKAPRAKKEKRSAAPADPTVDVPETAVEEETLE